MAKPNLTPPNLTPQDINRFWSKVNKAPGQGPQGDCWEWTAAKRTNGYGQFHFGPNKGRGLIAHRVAYLIANNEWPSGLVLHKCDNPPCCNPNHLFQGTSQDNSDDMRSKGRQASCVGADNGGAVLTDDQVMEIREMYASSDITIMEIAERYGVIFQTVDLIVSGKTWKHLPVLVNQKRKLPGEKNPSAKLTEKQVVEIRQKFQPRKYSRRMLASEYSVCVNTIQNILDGHTWAHLKH